MSPITFYSNLATVAKGATERGNPFPFATFVRLLRHQEGA